MFKFIKYYYSKKSVTLIGNYSFSYCSNLINITIPDNVWTIVNNSFEYCSNLININILKSVTLIGNYIFYYCSNLLNINILKRVLHQLIIMNFLIVQIY